MMIWTWLKTELGIENGNFFFIYPVITYLRRSGNICIREIDFVINLGDDINMIMNYVK